MLDLCLWQVMSLSPAPLSLLIKAAPILTDDMYGDIQPAAWELLLSVDEHMAAAAGESFVLAAHSRITGQFGHHLFSSNRTFIYIFGYVKKRNRSGFKKNIQ